MENTLKLLRREFNNRIDLRVKRPGIFKLLAPFYHEDGDMLDIFLTRHNGIIRICDYGLTLMRLSYSFEINTPTRERIFQTILAENGITEDNGNLVFDSTETDIYPSILHYAQVIAKVSNMDILKREAIKSLFYEMLDAYIEESLGRFKPTKNYLPIPNSEEYEVDYFFDIQPRPIYLFGVKDNAKARLVTISCMKFMSENIPFKSCVVHEDIDNLTKKDRNRLTDVVEKQFTTLEKFEQGGERYIGAA